VTADHPARRLWHTLETLHAVTYFDPRCRAAATELGLKGFKMGYFAFRSAPLGAVGPEPVVALFAGFRPSMVARALPDAWGYASPPDCLEARRASAAAALRAIGADEAACATAAATLEPVAAGLDLTGRPLAAANSALALADDPVACVWQLATTFREHRGDGHVAALVAAGLSGLEAHVLRSARPAGAPPDDLQAARGWNADEWDHAAAGLRSRGVTPSDLDDVERRTDEAAWVGGQGALGADGVDLLVDLLSPSVTAAMAALRYPNPIGLPAAG
jgi:hypothetical protein